QRSEAPGRRSFHSTATRASWRVHHGPQHVRSDSRRLGGLRLAALGGGPAPGGGAGGGPDPPYHAPVFVLTHHPHDPIDMEGGTTFYFVDGFETALAEAGKLADDGPIDIAGGASAVRQALQARCVNELVLDIVPVLLRDGERIFDDVPEFDAEAVEAATSPLATHVVYKVT